MLNINFILNYIVPSLFTSTLWSAFLSVLFSVLIVLALLITKPKDDDTFVYALIGCFFGIEIVCMIPMFAIPGIIQGLGKGSGYAILPVMFLGIILAPVGAILGSTVAPKLKFLRNKTLAKVLLLLFITYIVMAICIYTNFSLNCAKASSMWYCQEVGF
ncbi:MAG: hypothetical protein ACK5V6_17590 [Pseudanabaena sp.]|jgi:H+/Cl- antiporter ClcA